MSLDPRTPVIIGVGQVSERLGDPGYRRRSPVDLAADAAREALADTDADAGQVAAAIDTVASVRQFENSVPGARAPLGRSDNHPRSVASRIGARPARAILEVSGGQAPQHLVNEFTAVIAGGRAEAVLLVGSEAISTIERYAKAADRPDFTEHADGSLEDRGYGLAGMLSRHQARHGLTDAPSQYALIDNARRARLKQTRGPASGMAVRHALEVAGITAGDLATIDLYSCFPAPVFNICDGLGLAPDDPRGLTLTGRLPFFGGAGNDYSMHAIAETVQRARQAPGSYGLVGANGGIMSKYSVGVYSTTPAAWAPDRSADLQAEINSWTAPPQTRQPDGWATIETYTIKHGRDGARTGIVIGRLDADGSRFMARGDDCDSELLDLLTSPEPVSQPVFVRSFGFGNRVTTTAARMNELFPPEPLVLRDRYEHVLVRRDGHLLEVTINRPDVRNSLHPMASDELDHVFDAYFADPELWVAILTGAGEVAFSAGNDLIYSASGQPMWVPKNGFAGLTSRRHMPKPVIAAVNGYAMGGGCEIALACHLVVADATAQFALSEVKVGLVAGAGGVVRLPRTVPPKVATEMILTGRRLSAAEALGYGLVNRVVDAGAALDGARVLAAEILDGSPTSVRISLQVMEETRGIGDVIDAVIHPTTAFDDLRASEDALEGLTAFAQKRRPNWRNR
jgi:acetyl-CoA C-acetyltransferase